MSRFFSHSRGQKKYKMTIQNVHYCPTFYFYKKRHTMVVDSDLIKITEDGQVTKRIIKPGVGKVPEKNNTVTGTLFFSLFDYAFDQFT